MTSFHDLQSLIYDAIAEDVFHARVFFWFCFVLTSTVRQYGSFANVGGDLLSVRL